MSLTDLKISSMGNQLRDVSVVGSGGFATVYRAFYIPLGRWVAIKVLAKQEDEYDAEKLLRFKREAKLLATIRHRNIVQVYSSGSLDDGRFYIMIEYVSGKTLSELLSTEAPLDLARIRRLLIGLLHGLSAIHRAGVVHRDLTPGNCIVVQTDTPGHEEIKIFDFGLAKPLGGSDQRLTAPGLTVGTLAYISPEACIRDKVTDQRSDIYSLGCILYFMVTGQPPFLEPTVSGVMRAHIEQKQQPTYERLDGATVMYPNLERVLNVAMAKEPTDRYQTVEEFERDLQNLDQSSALPNPATVQKTASKFGGPLVCLVSFLIAVGIFGAMSGNQPKNGTRLMSPVECQAEINAIQRIDPPSPNSKGQVLASACNELFKLRIRKAELLAQKYSGLGNESNEAVFATVAAYVDAANVAPGASQAAAALNTANGVAKGLCKRQISDARGFWLSGQGFTLMDNKTCSIEDVLRTYELLCFGKSESSMSRNSRIKTVFLELRRAEPCNQWSSDSPFIFINLLTNKSLNEGDVASAKNIYLDYARMFSDTSPRECDVGCATMLRLATSIGQQPHHEKEAIEICKSIIRRIDPSLSAEGPNEFSEKRLAVMQAATSWQVDWLERSQHRAAAIQVLEHLEQVIIGLPETKKGAASAARSAEQLASLHADNSEYEQAMHCLLRAEHLYLRAGQPQAARAIWRCLGPMIYRARDSAGNLSLFEKELAVVPDEYKTDLLEVICRMQLALGKHADHDESIKQLVEQTKHIVKTKRATLKTLSLIQRIVDMANRDRNSPASDLELLKLAEALDTSALAETPELPIFYHWLAYSFNNAEQPEAVQKCLEKLRTMALGLNAKSEPFYARELLIQNVQVNRRLGRPSEAIRYAQLGLETCKLHADEMRGKTRENPSKVFEVLLAEGHEAQDIARLKQLSLADKVGYSKSLRQWLETIRSRLKAEGLNSHILILVRLAMEPETPVKKHTSTWTELRKLADSMDPSALESCCEIPVFYEFLNGLSLRDNNIEMTEKYRKKLRTFCLKLNDASDPAVSREAFARFAIANFRDHRYDEARLYAQRSLAISKAHAGVWGNENVVAFQQMLSHIEKVRADALRKKQKTLPKVLSSAITGIRSG